MRLRLILNITNERGSSESGFVLSGQRDPGRDAAGERGKGGQRLLLSGPSGHGAGVNRRQALPSSYLRTLKNDAIYKSGRQLRGEDGKELKGRREKLALIPKTRFGQHLDMVWWIQNEFSVQQKLYEAGADVPRPIRHNGNTILMEYVGDEWLPRRH